LVLTPVPGVIDTGTETVKGGVGASTTAECSSGAALVISRSALGTDAGRVCSSLASRRCLLLLFSLSSPSNIVLGWDESGVRSGGVVDDADDEMVMMQPAVKLFIHHAKEIKSLNDFCVMSCHTCQSEKISEIHLLSA